MEKKSHHRHHHLTAEANKKRTTDSQSIEFIQHVHELRNRIFWVALLFIGASALAYQFRDILVHLVLSPLGDQKLIYLTPSGGFSFIFQITMYAGAIFAAPLLVFQLYKFVVPALPGRARRHAALVFISAFLLMCSGVAFGYFVAVPSALSFLTTFAGGYVNASLTADSYLGFIIAYVFGLGALFQIPLLLIFWHWISPLTPKQLLNSERFMLIFALIAAAIITPTPDVVNQMIIAGPILVIYQVGVIAILIMIKAERKRPRRVVVGDLLVSLVAQRAQSMHLPSLTLPSIEDLAPRRPVATVSGERSNSLNKKLLTTQKPILPVAAPVQPHVNLAPITTRLTLGSFTAAPQRAHSVNDRSRPTLSSRPLPRVSRQRVMSLDGFVVSS
ncbi:twin-arginine translocase subunit TatC [Pedobacter sp.]|nr:twin-arginine translocase subunit TatC [Candidatus Saccharibacteria bacterium]